MTMYQSPLNDNESMSMNIAVHINFVCFQKCFYQQMTTSKMPIKHAPADIWKQADTVCFDVDSTLIQDEGLDELANFCGVGKVVKEW